jgi:C4-type Zn-finger protein
MVIKKINNNRERGATSSIHRIKYVSKVKIQQRRCRQCDFVSSECIMASHNGKNFV